MDDDSTLFAARARELAATIFGSPCQFVFGTDEKPFLGGECMVYVLEQLSSRQKIAIRVLQNRTDPYASLRVEWEAGFRQRIDKAALGLFPPLLHFSSTTDNVLQSPFLALGWVDGRPLKWSPTYPVNVAERQSIIRAVTNACLDLLTINSQGTTVLDWIQSKIYRKMERARKGQLQGGSVEECKQELALVQKYWIQDLDVAPHVLVHGDLSGNNIIVDEHSNTVKGIIDLGWADLVPLQFAACYPRFLTCEPDENGRFTRLGDPNDMMRRDRAFFLGCIKDRATGPGGNDMERAYHQALAREDEVSRYWWVAAASRIDIHHAMVKCDWRPEADGRL